MAIREILHNKRFETEEHIKKLEETGTAGKRYTCILSDISFLILGILCDAGWFIQLVFGVIYLRDVLNPALLVIIIALITGVAMTIYLNRIKEKEIALIYQIGLSFGLTVFAGLAGGIAGIIVGNIWLIIGGAVNYLAGLPILLSFKRGIIYGIQ